MPSNPLPWYHQGLRFTCTGCGKCCTGSPGVVWLTEEELAKIATFLGLSIEQVCAKHIRKVAGRLALVEVKRSAQEFDCTFLQGKACTIYPVRPKQCQTFPWWEENLSSCDAWKEIGQYCEGIDHPNASPLSLEEIQKHLS